MDRSKKNNCVPGDKGDVFEQLKSLSCISIAAWSDGVYKYYLNLNIIMFQL